MDSADTRKAIEYFIDHLPTLIGAVAAAVASIFSALSWRRNKANAVIAEETKAVVTEQHKDLVNKLEENTEITNAGVEQAKFAFNEANSVNAKLLAIHKDNLALHEAQNRLRDEHKESLSKQAEAVLEASLREQRHAAANREHLEQVQKALEEMNSRLPEKP